MPKQQAMVSRRLTAPFSDWWIAVQDRRSSPERWARRNFALNMSLSLALAAAAARRHPAHDAQRRARDAPLGDEERLRLERLARAAHAARLDPRLRRADAHRPRREPREDPRVRRADRGGGAAPGPAGREHPRLLADRVRAQGLPVRGRGPRRARPPRAWRASRRRVRSARLPRRAAGARRRRCPG